jgi:hypothetical protein
MPRRNNVEAPMQGMGNNGEEIVLTGKKSFTCFRKKNGSRTFGRKVFVRQAFGTVRFYYFDDYRGHHRKGIIVPLK